jgi:hypothetical protein
MKRALLSLSAFLLLLVGCERRPDFEAYCAGAAP